MTWARPHSLVVLIGAVTIVPMVVLGWLTVRILLQDRAVERQRQDDALDVEAGRVALDIERRLRELESEIANGQGLRLAPGGLAAASGSEPLFQAAGLPASGRDAVFAQAEADEQQGRLDAALEHYQTMTKAIDPEVSAGAWLRLGRTLRMKNDVTGARNAYLHLEALGDVPAAGIPSALVGRFASGRLFEQMGDIDRLRDTGRELARSLAHGGWHIDRETFESYSDAATKWGGPSTDGDSVARTDAAVDLWKRWRRAVLPAEGRQLSPTGDTMTLSIWATTADGPVARILTSAELQTWLAPAWSARTLSVAATNDDGRRVFGEGGRAGTTLLRSDTRLPFTLHVAATGPPAPATGRTMLVAGMALTFVLMLGASYGLYRTTTRETSLARQQADFVSAVSHEFRTPLTSMRHIMDLLVNRGVPTEERRAHYYHLLTDETERLHRMVETLLSFGRIEAGAYSWQLAPMSPQALVDRVVEDFRRELFARGREIRVECAADLPSILADTDALSRALWNLLDNAVKYSAPDTPVVVFARTAAAGVEVGVRDCGAGIPPAEHDRIFEKFVRGAGAKSAGTRGVGVGLALVRTIVSAHRGTVSVESTAGAGSTFVISLPRAAEAGLA